MTGNPEPLLPVSGPLALWQRSLREAFPQARIESALKVLRAGTVVAYEPMVAVGPDAFYLEDRILVTEAGHEALSSGLPYSADEISDLMRSEQAVVKPW
ncbi:MAG: hypothetical protein ACE5HV_13110 [Acidobacteriota bacterium]